jgi:hypothetical protein
VHLQQPRVRFPPSADLTADNAGLIDQIHVYENVKCWAAGQQARLSVAFEARLRQEQADLTPTGRHWPPKTWARTARKNRDLGAAEQIALARGESPNRGQRLLGTAKALVQMPHTLRALETGQLNEERVMYVAKETACLSVEDRTAVDEELAADTGTFTGAGTRTVIAAVRAAATRRDPRSVAQRASHAPSERRVSLRPAPGCMTYLTALLPVHEGVAVYTALTRNADTLHAAGDPRSLGQIKADTLVERTTGTPGGITGIELNLVMTDRTLLQGDSEPARIPGYGVVPGAWARELIAQGAQQEEAQRQASAALHVSGSQARPQPAAGDSAAGSAAAGVKELKTWIRRLYTAPGDRRPRRHGLAKTPLPGTAAPLHPDPRRHLPHPLLRCPDPPPRPHHPLAQRRPHHPGQRRGTVRSLQPHQRTPRLESPTQARPPAHHRTHHTHRPHLPIHRTTTTRSQTARNRASW